MKEKTLRSAFDKIIENSFRDFNRIVNNQYISEAFNQDDFIIQKYSDNIDFKSFRWEDVLIDSSKKLVDFGVRLVDKYPNLFPLLLNLALSQKKQISQRASRVVYNSIELDLNKYDEYLDEILQGLKFVKDESLIFNLLRVFTISKLPKNDDLEFLTDYCFKVLNKNLEKVAIKAYAMVILFRISNINPEIRIELINFLEIYQESESPGLACRSSKLLNDLRKDC
jgi:hypothetical protein